MEKAVRIQTLAFDAKYKQPGCFWTSARYAFGHIVLGTLLGTHGAFIRFLCQKSEEKGRKAAVFQTAAFVKAGAKGPRFD